MCVKAKHSFFIHSFLFSVLSLGIFPIITLAYPNFGSQCSSCHASSVEDTAEFITGTEEDTTATEETSTETIIEEDIITPATGEEDATTEENSTQTTIEEDTTTPTTEANTVESTIVPTSNNNMTVVTTPFDLNSDGQITQDEVQALQTEFFDHADTNADGFLTGKELQV